MNNSLKIKMLMYRRDLLDRRDPAGNRNIINKLNRKINALSKA